MPAHFAESLCHPSGDRFLNKNENSVLITHLGWFRLIRVCYSFVLSLACVLGCVPPAAADSAIDADPVVMPDATWDPFSPLAAYAPFLNYGSTLHEDAVAHSDGYEWRGVTPTQPDWHGVGRDTAYFLGYQFAVIAALYIAPESISGWDREQKRNYDFDKWRNNVSEPVWDHDRWWINYILHPYWGGAYYIRARERGLDRAQSFWYSALLSTLYEYGAEALAEPVSIQDLVVTPVAGYFVGEYLMTPLRNRIRAKPGKLDWSDKTLLFITDPLGVVSAETDQLLGVKTTLQWQPIGMQNPALTAAMGNSAASPSGPPRSLAPAWGLQFRADW
jgi:hypothetical protein